MKVYFETERLIIREPIAEDFDSIWAMRNDEAVTEFTGGLTRLSRDEAYQKHLKRCEQYDDTAKEYSVVLT
ncbi:hypothetical protein [Fusibacter sp. 3D3]|uniref:hypothetical protein n=1 Tax=Fusibacter sp. 3D3 TaxID=1048380 RepID=UPI000852FA7B|nr:hypothetical protein [Fusibacter sp. 3D3]GAU75442.1 hypothetical protein F3D3_0028 [Fusibacter sp. 3D3]